MIERYTLALITEWCAPTERGRAVDLQQVTYLVDMSAGRTFRYSTVFGPSPTLTQSPDQPAGGMLRVPAPGDVVLIELNRFGTVQSWAYVQHYLDMVDHQRSIQRAA